MPTIESAKKRVKTAAKKEKINKKWKEKLKNSIKEMEDIIEAGDSEQAQDQLAETYKIIDKAVTKNIIHKNKANRKKSRLAKRVKQLD